MANFGKINVKFENEYLGDLVTSMTALTFGLYQQVDLSQM